MKALKFALSFFCLSLSFLLPLTAFSQSETATLNGIVTDVQGASLPGSTVVLTSYSQSRRYHLTTNASGQFTFPLLPPGSYKLLASHGGFSPLQVLSIQLNADDTKTLGVQLRIGRVDQQVTVIGTEQIVNTSPSVSTTIDKNFVAELPLDGRSIQSLLLLSPGVVSAPLVSGGVGQFSVNGQRTDQNYFTVDGASANNGVNPGATGGVNAKYLAGTLPELNAVGTTSSLISIDSLDQFTIQTSSTTADSGRQSGGQVQLVSRAGTNQYHGNAFDYLRNEFFDARIYYLRTCNATTGVCITGHKTKTRQNDFGGSFSGPLRIPMLYNGRDKTFFFFSFEAQRLQSPAFTNGTYVPSLAFRAQAAAANSSFTPILNAYPIPNGPNDPSGDWTQFNASYTTPYNTNATSARVDQNIGDKLHLFARYAYAPSSSNARLLAVFQATQQEAVSGTVGATYTFTPHLANELTLNYTRNKGATLSYFDNFYGAVPVDVGTLDEPYAGNGSRYASFSFFSDHISSSVTVGDTNTTLQRQSQLTDQLSYSLGKHTLRAGVDVRLLAPVYQPIGYQASYATNSTQLVLSSQLEDYGITSTQEEHIHFHYFSLSAQDTWRPTSRLSFDYGIRWDLDPPPSEESGRRPASIIVPNINDLSTMRLATPSDPYYKTSLGAVAPRFGGAYIVHTAPGAETVVRGGIGLYFDPNNDLAAAGYSSFPFQTSETVFPTPTVPVLTYPIPVSAAVPPSIGTLTLPTQINLPALEPNLDLPYNMQWNATVQQAFRGQSLQIAYVGSTGQRLLTTQLINHPPPATVANRSPLPPNPNFSTVNYTYNQPSSNYHSLQVQLIRPMSHGLQLLANYTWSHAIDDVSNDFSTGVLDRSDADFDVRHNFSAAFLYNTPLLRRTSGYGNAVLRGFANGWHLSTFALAHTGTPGNVSVGVYDTPTGSQVAARPDRVGGAPLWIPAPGREYGKRVNPAAFAAPPLYPGVQSFDTSDYARQGTTPRNVVTLPGLYQFNTSLSRQVAITERANLQIRVEAYNVTNHPSFGYYNLSWSPSAITSASSGFGYPSSATANSSLNGTNQLYNLGGPRSIQLSAKLQF